MISVVIPNFDDIRIVAAVAKISPSEAVKEILIVDGKSTNAEVLKYYQSISDAKVRVLQYEDAGIFDAINYGVSQSHGEIIYLQGSDDVVSDINVFDDVVKFFSVNHEYHGYCMGCKFVNDEGEVVREWEPRSVTRTKILFGILPPHFSLFLRRELYSRVGGFEVSKNGDLSLDSLWLVKMGVLIRDLKIITNNRYWLNMALGGLSTGSVGVVFRQNWRLLKLLKSRNWRPKTWLLISPIKMLSKLRQVKITNKLIFLNTKK